MIVSRQLDLDPGQPALRRRAGPTDRLTYRRGPRRTGALALEPVADVLAYGDDEVDLRAAVAAAARTRPAPDALRGRAAAARLR